MADNPTWAKIEATIVIDPDRWAELTAQGYGDIEIQHMIEKSITFNTDATKAPIFDMEARLVKYI